MIVDCHVHLSGFAPTDPPTAAERIALLRSRMDEAGITHAVVLTSRMFGDDDPTPARVLELIGDDPRFAVVAGVHCPRGEPENLLELSGLLRDGRIRGLKLYPGYQPFYVTDDALRPVHQLAERYRVPVMIHTGDTFRADARVKQSHPLTVDDVAVDFPGVTYVLCHVGNPWFVDAAEVLYKNENVRADISGLSVAGFGGRYGTLMRSRLEEVLAYVDRPDKLMFGTDWPICGLGDYVEFARSISMTEEEREGLMWKNAAELFGFEASAAAG